jgi:hypothetical protein
VKTDSRPNSSKKRENGWVRKEFLEETKKFWEQYAGHPLTDEDARQIIENMVEFIKTLSEWCDREKKSDHDNF